MSRYEEDCEAVIGTVWLFEGTVGGEITGHIIKLWEQMSQDNEGHR